MTAFLLVMRIPYLHFYLCFLVFRYFIGELFVQCGNLDVLSRGGARPVEDAH